MRMWLASYGYNIHLRELVWQVVKCNKKLQKTENWSKNAYGVAVNIHIYVCQKHASTRIKICTNGIIIYIMNKYAKWRRLAKTTTITENLKKLTIQIVTKKQIPAVHLLREFRMCM